MEISDADWQRECAERRQLNALAEQVIGAAYEVANTLGQASWRECTSGRC
jgi:hypothetical protein